MLTRLLLLLTAGMIAQTAPALCARVPASGERQCEDRFKAADLNHDRVLSSSEIGNARQQLPAAIANKDRVTREEFMVACLRGPRG